MAKAELKNKIVKKMVEVMVNEPANVVLTLTLQEACALRVLTGSVGGCSNGTIREFTDGIFNSLTSVVNAPNLKCVFADVALAPNSKNELVANGIANSAKVEILKLYP